MARESVSLAEVRSPGRGPGESGITLSIWRSGAPGASVREEGPGALLRRRFYHDQNKDRVGDTGLASQGSTCGNQGLRVVRRTCCPMLVKYYRDILNIGL